MIIIEDGSERSIEATPAGSSTMMVKGGGGVMSNGILFVQDSIMGIPMTLAVRESDAKRVYNVSDSASPRTLQAILGVSGGKQLDSVTALKVAASVLRLGGFVPRQGPEDGLFIHDPSTGVSDLLGLLESGSSMILTEAKSSERTTSDSADNGSIDHGEAAQPGALLPGLINPGTPDNMSATTTLTKSTGD